jgi:hypothetical protein
MEFSIYQGATIVDLSVNITLDPDYRLPPAALALSVSLAKTLYIFMFSSSFVILSKKKSSFVIFAYNKYVIYFRPLRVKLLVVPTLLYGRQRMWSPACLPRDLS